MIAKETIENIQGLHFNRVRNPSEVVADMLDCDIVVSESEIQSCNYVQFWTNTLRKGMNPLIPPAMG